MEYFTYWVLSLHGLLFTSIAIADGSGWRSLHESVVTATLCACIMVLAVFVVFGVALVAALGSTMQNDATATVWSILWQLLVHLVPAIVITFMPWSRKRARIDIAILLAAILAISYQIVVWLVYGLGTPGGAYQLRFDHAGAVQGTSVGCLLLFISASILTGAYVSVASVR